MYLSASCIGPSRQRAPLRMTKLLDYSKNETALKPPAEQPSRSYPSARNESLPGQVIGGKFVRKSCGGQCGEARARMWRREAFGVRSFSKNRRTRTPSLARVLQLFAVCSTPMANQSSQTGLRHDFSNIKCGLNILRAIAKTGRSGCTGNAGYRNERKY